MAQPRFMFVGDRTGTLAGKKLNTKKGSEKASASALTTAVPSPAPAHDDTAAFARGGCCCHYLGCRPHCHEPCRRGRRQRFRYRLR
jgi:hypothetical protein